MCAGECMGVCVSVCVMKRERERVRVGGHVNVNLIMLETLSLIEADQ